MSHKFQIGAAVKVDALGLSGIKLLVSEQVKGPDGNAGYVVKAASNGAIMPGRYDERLVRAA